jgi:hypothetical protein
MLGKGPPSDHTYKVIHKFYIYLALDSLVLVIVLIIKIICKRLSARLVSSKPSHFCGGTLVSNNWVITGRKEKSFLFKNNI